MQINTQGKPANQGALAIRCKLQSVVDHMAATSTPQYRLKTFVLIVLVPLPRLVFFQLNC